MTTLSLPPPHQRRAVSDERLVGLARDGDDAAFEAIVERYAPLLLRRARRIVGNEAPDAIQHAFISAWSALRGGCEVRELRPWLCTIAHRAALQMLRDRGERVVELPDSIAAHSSPVDQCEQAVRTRSILSAIATLPASEQQALVATSLLGLSGRATATTLGVSEGAVRQLVFRARTRLRAAVGVFMPPIFSTRLWDRWGHHARRVTTLGDGASGATSSPESVGMLVKLGATAAAGLAIAGPVVVFNHGRGHDAGPAAARTAGPTTAPAPARAVDRHRAHLRDSALGPAGHGAPAVAMRPGSDAGKTAPGTAPGGSTGSATGAREAPSAAASETHDDHGLPTAAREQTQAAPPSVGTVVAEVKEGGGQPAPVHQALPVVTEAVAGVQATVGEARGTLTDAGQAVVQQVKDVLPAPSKVVQSLPPLVHRP